MCDEQRKIAHDRNGRSFGVNTLGDVGGAADPGYAGEQLANYGRTAATPMPAGESDWSSPQQERMPTLRERLEKDRQNLRHRLAGVQQAIIALDEDPEFEKHERTRAAVQRTGHYYA